MRHGLINEVLYVTVVFRAGLTVASLLVGPSIDTTLHTYTWVTEVKGQWSHNVPAARGGAQCRYLHH